MQLQLNASRAGNTVERIVRIDGRVWVPDVGAVNGENLSLIEGVLFSQITAYSELFWPVMVTD